MNDTNDNLIANNYIVYLTSLTPAKLYAYFHGTYSIKNNCFNSYIKTLNLSYSEYKRIKEYFSDIDDYVCVMIKAPPKKIIKKTKQYFEEDIQFD